MSNFIQLVRDSEESEYLQENHPNAFLLLCLIARRARRTSGHPDGLKIGEAYLGDYEKAGIESRSKYRTALEVLIGRGHIKIQETCRTRKKVATGVTTHGTLIRLLNSDVWDINPESDDHYNRHRVATGSPPGRHEQERTIKNNNEKETTTPPNPQRGDRVVVFYECLKENDDLDESQKKSLNQFPENRVKMALDFSKHVAPKTTLIQMLFWHCKQENPPEIPKPKMTDQQKLATDFNNNYLKTIPRYELLYENNKESILHETMELPTGRISLKNSLDMLRKDFQDVKILDKGQRKLS